MVKIRSDKKKLKVVSAISHKQESRKNIPTSELEPLMHDEQRSPFQKAYTRRNRDLDPQLVWRGKDEQDGADLYVQVPPLYIQEKIHPQALIDDLRRETELRRKNLDSHIPDLFSDFNGLPNLNAKTEFYQHEQNWSNRMILGDALQVMASLSEREALRGKVQCIYVDPPYGIKFNSNWQMSINSRDVKDGKAEHITREPEQVKAFRDTWKDGIHSYLNYLRDRLTVARDLLTESGSIFVQIGDENVHRVRILMDEVFGVENFAQQIIFRTTAPLGSSDLSAPIAYILWYHKAKGHSKFRPLLEDKDRGAGTNYVWTGSFEHRHRLTSAEALSANLPNDLFYPSDFASTGYTKTCYYELSLWGHSISPGKKSWRTNSAGFQRLNRASRLMPLGAKNRPCYVQYYRDNPTQHFKNTWLDTRAAMNMNYVVETQDEVIKRCILMTTDPSDLVLDPTCGSGTTAYVSEQWGRRWITIDTSRVALTLARARLMGARYPYYLLTDSSEGRQKEAEIERRPVSEQPTYGNVRQGFVYERVPHITLKAIANNKEIDEIYEVHQPMVTSALSKLNDSLSLHSIPFTVEVGVRKEKSVQFNRKEDTGICSTEQEASPSKLFEWEVPQEAPVDWPDSAKKLHDKFWKERGKRQQAIDESIAANAEFEYRYDKPYEDKSKVRVAGPFTVESQNPHRMVEAASMTRKSKGTHGGSEARENIHREISSSKSEIDDFVALILKQLEVAGVQQRDKDSKIVFNSVQGWPGNRICAEGHYQESNNVTRRAAIHIGPEHGTLSRHELVTAAIEAGEAGFDVLITCAFNYDARTTEINKLGRLAILKARMNADLHMSDDLKDSKNANLFVIFGEPDIRILKSPQNQIRVQIQGIDIFDPRNGDVRTSNVNDLACWFIDTDYDMESFFVRHAYFLGAPDSYKKLKTTLKNEIDEQAWSSLYSDTSRPFDTPSSGRIAVKAINHLGDEVMKVFEIS